VVEAPPALVPLDPDAQCLSCGTAFDPGQDYCLECGARILRPAGPLPRLGRAWRRRLGWYPGDWIWGATLALAVAAGGAAAAIEIPRSGHANAQPRVIVALSKLRSAPAPKPPRPVHRPARAKAPATRPAPPRRPRPEGGLVEWPRRSGYTVILSSLPASGGLAAARQKAREALKRGLRQVGVLVSSRYASLHPGYYVVFSGVYSSLEEAQSAVSRASSRFPSAYAREIAP
jgi:hypothetical protein